MNKYIQHQNDAKLEKIINKILVQKSLWTNKTEHSLDKNKVSKKKKENKGKHRFKKSSLKVPSSRGARPAQTHRPNQYLCKFKELGKGLTHFNFIFTRFYAIDLRLQHQKLKANKNVCGAYKNSNLFIYSKISFLTNNMFTQNVYV